VKQIGIFEEFLPLRTEADKGEVIEYLYEPDRSAIIETLLPKYVSTKIYYALVESQTSEHAARMSAMENATSNCGEMVRYLTLVYNKRRQESITNEMMDIVGGAEALRGT
jgi:F-type H+-transporting ATPase subunit gamma